MPGTKSKNNSLAAGTVRDRLICSASRLFCRYGINAVGIDAVIADAGTAKASLYKNFGSKDALVEAVLEHEGAAWRDWFLGELHKGEAPPRDRLLRIFPILKQWFGQEGFFGCPFINAIGEHDKKDGRLRSIALRHKNVVIDALGVIAGDAGFAEPDAVAHRLGLLMDGAIVAAMVTGTSDHADMAERMARDLLVTL